LPFASSHNRIDQVSRAGPIKSNCVIVMS